MLNTMLEQLDLMVAGALATSLFITLPHNCVVLF
jgi:hypothetical protein